MWFIAIRRLNNPDGRCGNMNSFTILSPTAILGYGFPLSSFERGLACRPDLIAVDAGSTDPGPFYLGAGKSFTDRTAVCRDLKHLLRASIAHGIPLVERKPLAQALYRGVEVGDEVPPEHYAAVAEILAYGYRLSGKKSA